ncbi:MAG: cytidine deaminase [Candidatus Edwardsbacteria bacterium]|nr:cytidine deaminase [Candidatus Edwardsbacteria bacterium]MBU1577622.1 cytidine deaminase [Candidatus Edwardsbacteria bacterium]MBU2462961.1 cytidine deaminase [Candidatus Edwardsbacteria bacterium]MBU2595098.1 cytidine deaminase [Candidatus Edwardsbacteria bacterium]
MPSTKDLIASAKMAQKAAYAPYSKFKVGAALLGKSGRIFTGCNVENVSYGLACCAERNAVFKALSEGEREFRAIAIVSDSPEPTAPCGACRQVLNEFAPDISVIMPGKKRTIKTTLKKLLPFAFGPKSLK